MADKTPLGLTRLDPAESLATDGYSFQAINPIIIDRLLRVGVYLHRHDGHARLGDPTDEPEIRTEALGGMIPSDTLVGVCYTVVDEYGGESLPSPMAAESTPPGIAEPGDVPAYEIDNTQGNLRNGTYYYVMTLTDDTGGETVAGPPLQVDIQPGNDLNAVILSGLTEITESSEGATGWRLFKSTGASKFHYIADGPAGLDSITDDGLLCADCITEPPTTGHTNSTNRVIVTIPSAGVVEGAEFFRIYLGIDGDFTSPALGGEFTPDQADTEIVFNQLNLDTGTPPDASTTVAGAQQLNPDTDIINWPWKAPVATSADLPDDAETGDARFTLDTGIIWIFKDDQWIQFTAPPEFWKSPVTAIGDLPTVGNVPGDVRVVIADYSLHIWDVSGAGQWRLLSPRTVPIMDEGDVLPARGALDFAGSAVTVTDDPDNNKTVVTITGGGGGGGGSAEFISPDEGPIWYDTEGGPPGVKLRVGKDTQVLPLRQGVIPDFWVPDNAVELVGEHLELEGRANEHISLSLAGGPVWGNGLGTAVKAIWEITSDNWEYIGLKFLRGPGGTALEGRLVRDDAELQVFDNGVNVGSLALTNPVPAIGEQIALTLYLRPEPASSEGWIWWFQTDKGDAFGWDGGGTLGEIAWPDDEYNMPFVTGYWTNIDAYTIEDYAYGGFRVIHDLIFQDDYAPGASGSTGVNRVILGADGYQDSDGWMGWQGVDEWAYYDYYRSPQAGRYGMFWVLSGKFVKFTGDDPPVEGELILTIDFSQGASTMRLIEDFEFPVVTGDNDGRELGMVQVKKNGEVRWLAGRSSDPVTKAPWVRLDGINIPLARTSPFE